MKTPTSTKKSVVEEEFLFENRFEFSDDLPTPLPRVVSAFVYNPWAASHPKIKRPAPSPPLPQSNKDVQKPSSKKRNETITLKMVAKKGATYNTPLRLATFGKSGTESPKISASLKARKNKRHWSVIQSNVGTEAPKGNNSNTPKSETNNTQAILITEESEVETIRTWSRRPVEPIYESIDTIIVDDKVELLAAEVGRKLDHEILKPVVSESCASATMNRQRKMRHYSNNTPGIYHDPKGHREINGKHLTVQQGGGRISSEKTPESASERSKGNLKTYIFGETPEVVPARKERVLKERQCHLPEPNCSNPGMSNAVSTERRQNSKCTQPSRKNPIMASARKYKDNVFHANKKPHILSGRHLGHQIPRVVIGENKKKGAVPKMKLRRLTKPARSSHAKKSCSDAAQILNVDSLEEMFASTSRQRTPRLGSQSVDYDTYTRSTHKRENLTKMR